MQKICHQQLSEFFADSVEPGVICRTIGIGLEAKICDLGLGFATASPWRWP